jgi:ATP-dependent Clp protease ATP-binding subunit ClpC
MMAAEVGEIAMQENLTDTLRQVIERSRIEARNLDHDFAGTEHLLLGILHFGASDAVRALVAAGARVDPVREALLKTMPRVEQPSPESHPLPLSPKARRMIHAAVARAHRLRRRRVSTALLLLDLVDEPQTATQQALMNVGADLEQLRQLLTQRPDPAEP